MPSLWYSGGLVPPVAHTAYAVAYFYTLGSHQNCMANPLLKLSPSVEKGITSKSMRHMRKVHIAHPRMLKN